MDAIDAWIEEAERRAAQHRHLAKTTAIDRENNSAAQALEDLARDMRSKSAREQHGPCAAVAGHEGESISCEAENGHPAAHTGALPNGERFTWD